MWATITLFPLNSPQYNLDEINGIQDWHGPSFGLNQQETRENRKIVYTTYAKFDLMSEALYAQLEPRYNEYDLEWNDGQIVNADPHKERTVHEDKHGLTESIKEAIDNPPTGVARHEEFSNGLQSLIDRIDLDHDPSHYPTVPLDRQEENMRQRGEINSGEGTDPYKVLRYLVRRADITSLDYATGLKNIIDLLCNPSKYKYVGIRSTYTEIRRSNTV